MLMRSAIDALDVPIFLVGHDRKVEYANGAAHALFGYPDEHLHGVPVERLLTPERRGEVRNFADVLQGGSDRRVRSAVRTREGERLEVSLTLTACRDHNDQLLAVSTRLEQLPGSGRITPQARASVLHAPSMPPGAARLNPGLGHAETLPPPASSSLRDTQPEGAPPANMSSAPPANPLDSHMRLRGSGADVPGAALTVRIEQIAERVERLEQLLATPLHKSRSQALSTVAELRAYVQQARELAAELPASPEQPQQAVGAPPAPKLPSEQSRAASSAWHSPSCPTMVVSTAPAGG